MALTLDWNNEQEIQDIPDSLVAMLERLLEIAGRQEGIETGEVALTFVTDEAIHQLNKDYRGIDRPTDVLSFAMQETGDEEMEILFDEFEETAEEAMRQDEQEIELEELLGDIVISVERAKAQSEEYGHSFEREIGFLFVHGFLHLIGYDHEEEEDEKEMFAKQEQVLEQAGITR